MKILAVCQHYHPENFQITSICEQLVKDGHKVTALVGLPNYPIGVVPDEYKKGHRDEYINGVHVIRCYERGRKKGAFNLCLNYLSFWFSSCRKVNMLDDDYDIVFVYQLSPITMAIAGKKYAKKHKKPLLLYCCDLWPESMKMYIKSEKNIIFRVGKRISKSVYNSADLIACQSSTFIDYLSNTHGIPKEKLKYLPAFADEAYLEKDFTPEDDTVDFVFMGNLGIAQDLINVLEAVEIIKDIPNFKVHFVGDGSMLNEMKDFVDKHALQEKVIFYGRRPVEEMEKYYKLADACLVSLNDGNMTGLTLPSKVQGYMAAGKPIIGMINGSTRKVIDEAKCGACVPAGDYQSLAETMKDFITNKDKFSQCGENGREYFKRNYIKSTFIAALEDYFKMLICDR